MNPSAWGAAALEVPGPQQGEKQTSLNRAPKDNEPKENEGDKEMPVDVKEYPAKYVFIADVPGLKSHQIRVHVEDQNVLVINGERTRDDLVDKDEEKDAIYQRMERRIGKVTRKFTLPGCCKQDSVSTSCIDGVLTVTIAKGPPPEVTKDAATIQHQVIEKDNSTENKFMMNGVSLVEESLSNTTSSPNVSFNQHHLQECMMADEEYNIQKQRSDMHCKQPLVDKGDKTSELLGIAACDPDVEIVSSADFAIEAKEGRNELWPKTTISVFISKFERMYASLNFGYLAQKHWEEIANETNEICKSNLTGLQCRYKWNRLKKIYKREKLKLNVTGAKTSSWPYYEEFDRIVAKSRRKSKLSGGFDGLQWLNSEPPILSKRKERDAELLDEDALKDHENSTSRRFKEPSAKDMDGEGKRVKRVKSTMDSIAVAMEMNMKHLTETMKEIEQNKMRQESIQLDKILQTQLQIAQLFAQK